MKTTRSNCRRLELFLRREMVQILGNMAIIPFTLFLWGCDEPQTATVVRSDSSPATKVEEAPATPSAGKWLSDAEVAKVEGDFATNAVGELQYSIYNGSEHVLTSAYAEITVKNSDGSIALTRVYHLNWGYNLPPLTASGREPARLGFRLKEGQTWSARVVRARPSRDE